LEQPIIQAALRDESDYIRGQAACAMDDTAFFLETDAAYPYAANPAIAL
jgi:hypothetical protein